MSEVSGVKIYTKDELTIVSFEYKGFLGTQTFLGEVSEHLFKIVDDHRTKVLVIDLDRVSALPSNMLGVLVGLHRQGVTVRLYNITDDVDLILQTTNLKELFEIREGDLSALIEDATEE